MTTSLIPKHETLEIEFKSDRVPLNDDDLIEPLICLANAQMEKSGQLQRHGESRGTHYTFGHHSPRKNEQFMTDYEHIKTRKSLIYLSFHG